jgi:hypothetical protein
MAAGTGKVLAKKMLGLADEFMTGATKGATSSIKNVNSLTSNMTKAQKIARGAGDFVGGGTRETLKNMQGKPISLGNVGSAIKKAHTNADGSLNISRVAGSAMAVSAAGRVATGGGLYKDRYGNRNLIGVPFL